MKALLGIDTSNYTTSAALYFPESGEIKSEKKLLPVKKGERGLRQSDAVFHHTKQLNEVIGSLFDQKYEICGIGYSSAPRLVEGSYMPCFSVGENMALSLASILGVDVFATSHQCGHILAGLYSSGKLNMLNESKQFLAFHISGGTTDLLMCTPKDGNVVDIEEVGGTSDLKAGQAVDRIGVRLGLDFPCGMQLEKLAESIDFSGKVKPSIKGMRCSLSGVENKCVKMLSDGVEAEKVASYCLEYIYESVKAVTKNALVKYGDMPVLYVGGVMSNGIIKQRLKKDFNCFFAQPRLSSDNGVGTAIFSAIKEGLVRWERC